MNLTTRDRIRLVTLLRASRIAAGWEDAVRFGPETFSGLLAEIDAMGRGGGRARAIAQVARQVVCNYHQGQIHECSGKGADHPAGGAGDHRAAGADGAHVGGSRAASSRVAGRSEQGDRARCDDALTQQRTVIEEFEGLLVSLALMDERGPINDDLFQLARRHVEAGFALPPYVEERLHRAMVDHTKRTKAGGAFEPYPDYAINCIRYELLKAVATRLRGRQRESAHKLLDSWDRANDWTGRQFDSVERILSKAVNDCA